MSNQTEIHHFRLKTGDYNDVFSYDTVLIGTYDQVEQYLKDLIKPEYQKDINFDNSSTDPYVELFYPVTDDNGNEISRDDPRYEELSDQQELRVEFYAIAELIEGEYLNDYINSEDYSVIDLTVTNQ